MRQILAIMWNDLQVFFREPGQIIGLIIFPVVFTIGIGLGVGGGGAATTVRLDVIDQDNSAYSQQFITLLRQQSSSLILCPVDDAEARDCGLADNLAVDEARALSRLQENDTQAYVVIPAGFGEAVAADQPITLDYRTLEAIGQGSLSLTAVQAVAGQLGGAQIATRVSDTLLTALDLQPAAEDVAAVREDVYERANTLLEAELFTVDYRLSATDDPDAGQVVGTQSGFGQSVPGMGAMFVMFTVFTSLFTLIRERANWTLQRLVMMPVSRGQILAGKILMWFAAGMLQFAIVWGIGLVLRVNFGSQPLLILLVMMLFSLCITALAFAVSTLLKTEAQANSVSLLLALTIAPLGGAWWPLDVVPEFMRVIGHLTPVAWAMEAFRSLIFEQGTLLTILPSLGVLSAMTAAFFAFAIWRFRYN
jgi:ABC-2 type transport system permease protein